jgi:hypothetical protein
VKVASSLTKQKEEESLKAVTIKKLLYAGEREDDVDRLKTSGKRYHGVINIQDED